MMKRTVAILVFGIALFVGSTYASDFNKGVDAYNRGDWVEAVKWFRLGAEQGDAMAKYGFHQTHNETQPVDFNKMKI